MDGLNGDKVLTINDRFVGRVPGEAYGYKRNLRVTVDIRMEALTRQAEYEMTDHSKNIRPLDFALTTSVWRPDGKDSVAGGATVEPLRELVTFAGGFDADKAKELADLGERWHLNGMRAGCQHQRTVPAKDYADVPPCPETGYKYGHAWLVERLPLGFRDKILNLIPPQA